jgi:hypothetical protein
MIREAILKDCPRIAEIHIFGWRCAYKEFISIEYLINKMTVRNREEKFIEYLSNKNKKPIFMKRII